jgi:hypothetical protein
LEEWTVTGLAAGEAVHFSIRAIDEGGYVTALSNSVTAIPENYILQQVTHGGDDRDEAVAIVASPDGGFVVAGRTKSQGSGGYDAYVLKYDADLNLVWERTYGGPLDDWAADIITTHDGNYAVVATSMVSGGGTYDLLLFGLDDQTGAQTWDYLYQDEEKVYPNALTQTSDGGFVVGGGISNLFFLLKLDANRDEQWTKSYEAHYEGYHASVTDVGSDESGRLIVTHWREYCNGSYPGFPCSRYYSEARLSCYSGSGNDLWGLTFMTGSSGILSDVRSSRLIECIDGGFLGMGYGLRGYYGALFTKIDSDGRLLWQESYNPYYRCVAETSQANLVSAGRGSGGAQILLMDSQGGLVNEIALGGDYSAQFEAVAVLSDGSIVAVGWVDVPERDFDILIARLSGNF